MNNKPLRLVTIIVSLFIGSWLLVHSLALFGIFLAMAYPLIWLLIPTKTPCLLCRAGIEGGRCAFCKRKISKKERTSPSGLYSAMLNGILIFIFSVTSAGLVLLESRIVFNTTFPLTPKTAKFAIPDKGQYRLGETFPLKVEINGIKVPVNAVQVDLAFDPERLMVEGVSTEGSFATVFVQKEIDNQKGYVRLSGGLPNPGYFSETGTFGTIYFKGKSTGAVKVEYLPSSKVLANDGRGTDVLEDLSSVSYLILPDTVSEGEKKTPEPVVNKSSARTQMVFYEEKGVLGAETFESQPEVKIPKKENPIFGVFKSINDFILRQWSNLLTPFVALTD